MSTDYFPPIQRAVQGLSPNTLEARRILYDKARGALLRQLQNADPALTESQITKERLLLEDAIRRIETDMLRPETAERVLGPDISSAFPEDEVGPDISPDEAAAPEPLPESDAPIGAASPRRRRNGDGRPPAPRRAVAGDRRNARFAVIGGVALVLILGAAAGMALLKPDDGEDAASVTPIQTTATQQPAANAPAPAATPQGKINDRIGDAPAEPATTPPAQQQAALPAAASPATTQTPASTAAQPLAPATPAGGDAQVAQQAILFEEQPDNPQQGQAFRGTVTWRSESVSSGANSPLETAIRGDLDVPERKLHATITLRRNTDPALPATHTLQIQFTVPPDFPNGGVSNVPGVLMKQAMQQRGQALQGLSVKVTSGYFLVGLQDLPTEPGRNTQLLKERGWIDIPVLYENGRRAIITLEKGVPGERIFDDAFAAWEKPQSAQQ